MIADLTIGGVDVPNADHAVGLSVSIELDGGITYRVRGDGSVAKLQGPRAGKRKISISASGLYPPDLATVDWAAPVVITYKDLALDDASSSITVLSDGPRTDQDLRRVATGWTLEGREV